MCRSRWRRGGWWRRGSAAAPEGCCPQPCQGRGDSEGDTPARVSARPQTPTSRHLIPAGPQQSPQGAAGVWQEEMGVGSPPLPPSRSGVSQAPTSPFSELGLSGRARLAALRSGPGQPSGFEPSCVGASCRLNPQSRGGSEHLFYLAFAQAQMGFSPPPPLSTAPAPCCQASLSAYTARPSSPLHYKPPLVLLVLPVLPTLEQIPILFFQNPS